MKIRYLAIAACITMLMNYCTPAPKAPTLQGTWKMEALTPVDSSSLDTGDNFGLALLVLAMAMGHMDTISISHDSVFTHNSFTGNLTTKDSFFLVKNDDGIDTSTYALSTDTLRIWPGTRKDICLVLTRIGR